MKWLLNQGFVIAWGVVPVSFILLSDVTLLNNRNCFSLHLLYSGYNVVYVIQILLAFQYASFIFVRSLLRPLMSALSVQRSKVVCSRQHGKAKCVRAVTRRFYRLDWGAWIRPKAGRHKKLWKKNKSRKFRLRQHVFCNRTQSKLLDKMVTAYWTRKRHYIDDPYEPYQRRTNFPLLPDKPKPFYP